VSDIFSFRAQLAIFLCFTLAFLPVFRGNFLSPVLLILFISSLEFYNQIKGRWRVLYWCFVTLIIGELFLDSLFALRSGTSVMGWKLLASFTALILPNLIALASPEKSPAAIPVDQSDTTMATA
jgi:hypothetical protein